MPTHNDSQKIYKKMSEENQPLPQTIIKGHPLRTAHQKRQLNRELFLPSLHDCSLVDSKQPRINGSLSAGGFCFKN